MAEDIKSRDLPGFFNMTNDKYKTFVKLISLILAQMFLFSGQIYPVATSNKNIFSIHIEDMSLRVPINPSNYNEMRLVLSEQEKSDPGAKSIRISLLKHNDHIYKDEISHNAAAMFNSIGYGSEWRKGSVVLNLGSGGNPVMAGNFINVDDAPLGASGGRFFKGNYLKHDFLGRIMDEELKPGEKITGVLLYNTWLYITSIYIHESLMALNDSEREKVSFGYHFGRIWNDILPGGGDLVFMDYMPPEQRDLEKSQEIVLKVMEFVKSLKLNNIASITKIIDAESGYVIGLVIKKKDMFNISGKGFREAI
ncbi:MAG: hypothetical protein WC312_00120 [Candidatus Omnitrophota bacterium]|jgi:hypothetical protein